MLIRQETGSDFDAVYTIVQEAFAAAEHSDGNEQDLVTELRGSAAFIPELSLVAETDGKLAGHIMFTRGSVGEKRSWYWHRWQCCRNISSTVSAAL